MSDLVEKLRYDPNGRTLMPAELRWRCEEAADRIEALEAENERLREDSNIWARRYKKAIDQLGRSPDADIARAALTPPSHTSNEE